MATSVKAIMPQSFAWNHVGKDPSVKFLVFGRTGWLGGLLGELLTGRDITWAYATSRLENKQDVEEEIAFAKPTHVLNAAGLTGRPNVDWCETHREEVLRVNVCGTLLLADACAAADIHMTNYATGCIFEYDDKHPLGSGIGFTEDEAANFAGSFYSKTKGMVEPLMKEFSTCLSLRVRMPISSDLDNPRNFIYKIARYAKVVNIPNSMTVLDELLPYSIDLALRKRVGVMNFTNPGVVSHNECLEMYRDYVKPDFKWANFSLEEQAKVIQAGRSNNELDASKLKGEFPQMLGIKESLIEHVFKPYAARMKGGQ